MEHYQTLGLRRSCSRNEIKRAYHELALKYHPDKNKDPKAWEKFKSVDKAYKILINEHIEGQKDDIHSHKHRSQREYRDESFFHGSKQKSHDISLQNEIKRIRKINSDLLDEVNHKSTSSKVAKRESKNRSSASGKIFVGKILPEMEDDEYENLVLERLRSSWKEEVA